jgi:hypothetical protein
MEILRWKARIAVLWLFMAIAMSAHGILAFMAPGAIAEIEDMTLGPGMMVFMVIFWLVPLWLAFVTMTVKDSYNRWTNFVLGIIFTILNIFHLIEHLAQPSVEQILIIGSTVAVTALIAWYAWKWPKQK